MILNQLPKDMLLLTILLHLGIKNLFLVKKIIHFLIDFSQKCREAILEDRFEEFYNEHYDKYIDKILNLEDNLKYTYKRENYFVLDNANYNKKYPNKSDDGKLTLGVVSLGSDEYKRYVNKLNLNYEEVKDKSILIKKGSICSKER